MADLAQDLKFAVRALLKAPGVALVAILTLALGIGANSASFSVVNGVVLKQLPYAEPESLVYVNGAFPSMGLTDFWMSQPEYDEYAEWGDELESIGAFTTGEVSAATATQPLRVRSGSATRSFSSTLGIEPLHGDRSAGGRLGLALHGNPAVWHRHDGLEPSLPCPVCSWWWHCWLA
jgi:putative ABC transport system permease protein